MTGRAASHQSDQRGKRSRRCKRGGRKPSREGDQKGARQAIRNRAPRRGADFRQGGARSSRRAGGKWEALSASLYRPLATKPLHRLRISAKRLRYAIELLATCWGEALARSQGDRGITIVARRASRLRRGDRIPRSAAVTRWRRPKPFEWKPQASQTRRLVGERRAAVWRCKHFIDERTMHFREALARWHGWESEAFTARC